jgi:RES domain-containing protein
MVLWRISPFHDLNGEGGRLFSARWHTAGLPVVYLAESPAGALLEMCVHTTADDLPISYTMLKVRGPENPAMEISAIHLPSNWVQDESATRRFGTEWLRSATSALLRVPSVMVPETWNVLLNPLHPQAKEFVIEHVYEYPFDFRLKQ